VIFVDIIAPATTTTITITKAITVARAVFVCDGWLVMVPCERYSEVVFVMGPSVVDLSIITYGWGVSE
jgi:hypothetical protein